MQVRVMKGKKEAGFYTCSHIVETFLDDGIKLELVNPDGKVGKRKVVRLPRDGNPVYYMDGGKTVDTKRWPPKEKPKPKNTIVSEPLHIRG